MKLKFEELDKLLEVLKPLFNSGAIPDHRSEDGVHVTFNVIEGILIVNINIETDDKKQLHNAFRKLQVLKDMNPEDIIKNLVT